MTAADSELVHIGYVQKFSLAPNILLQYTSYTARAVQVCGGEAGLYHRSWFVCDADHTALYLHKMEEDAIQIRCGQCLHCRIEHNILQKVNVYAWNTSLI
eukprot:SAG11_NODE_609_length_8224_cov_5.446154_1_plen_100_part_00